MVGLNRGVGVWMRSAFSRDGQRPNATRIGVFCAPVEKKVLDKKPLTAKSFESVSHDRWHFKAVVRVRFFHPTTQALSFTVSFEVHFCQHSHGFGKRLALPLLPMRVELVPKRRFVRTGGSRRRVENRGFLFVVGQSPTGATE